MRSVELSLTVRGPVLSAGLGTPDLRLDAAMRRDAGGRHVIPGSLVRGRMREALEEMLATTGADPAAVSAVFGGPDGPRSRVVVGDFVEAVQPSRGLTPRVSISPVTGTARAAQLAFLEGAPDPADRVFHGRLRLPEGGAAGLDSADLERLLRCTLAWARHLGKSGTAGWGAFTAGPVDTTGLRGLLGRLTPDQSGPHRPTGYTWQRAAAPAGRLRVTVTLKSPLVVADGRAKDNTFEGRDDLPGSVLRRALADRLLGLAGLPPGGWVRSDLPGLSGPTAALAAAFGEVHASFLRWAPDGSNPVVPYPASARWAGRADSEPVDGLRAFLDRQEPTGDRWAFDVETARWLRTVGLPRTLVAHVAMDRLTRSAQHGMLYTVQAIAESWKGGPTCFVGEVRCPDDLVGEVARRLEEVSALGKATRAGHGQVEVKVGDAGPEDDGLLERLAGWNRGGRGGIEVPITLASEALLLDALRDPEMTVGADLTGAYRRVFRALLGVEVEVPALLAFHRLRGGATAWGPDAVPPAVLTRAGSTLVLRFPDGMPADEVVNRLGALRAGAVNADAVGALEEAWQRPVPFVPESGYGELILIHPLHLAGGETT